MAVLYRSHFHALELQLELTKRGVPFTITSGIRFFEQAHIKDVTAYLKLVLNPRDEIAFKRLVQLLPGIGGKGAEKLWGVYAPAAAAPGSQLAPALRACARSIPKKAAAAWTQFAATLEQLESGDVRDNATQMIGLVIDAGYEDYLEANYDNHHSRLDDLEQLASFGRQFPSLEGFLTQLALLTSIEAEDDKPAREDEEKLRLSTVHQAKGLEFDVVFIIMLCDGLFPSARSAETPAGEEEERRLMYVAITRARNELYLTYPLVRALRGSEGDFIQKPSRFIEEIPTDLLEEWNLKPYNPYG
jgi:DNA helicase-2/ATP-dependent DNA helicase PcrA